LEAQRLPGGPAFARVFEEGISRAGRLLVLHARPGLHEPARVGFAVGKRLGGAVVRNRIRRRMRQAFRDLEGCATGADLVFVARGRIVDASLPSIRREMRILLAGLSGARCAGEGFPGIDVESEGL